MRFGGGCQQGDILTFLTVFYNAKMCERSSEYGIGIFLGLSVLGIITETKSLEELSQVGVVLLMFIAGLETDTKEFKKSFKSSMFVGFGGIFVPFGLGFIAGNMMNLSVLGSWFLGLLLSATSVSISVQTLKEMNFLKTKEGASIRGAAEYLGITAEFTGLLDHIWKIVLLSILAISTKLIGAALGARLSGFNYKSSLGIGASMIARGEVALIMAKIGLDSGLLNEELFAVLVIVVLMTTLVAPPLIKLFFGTRTEINKSI